MAPCWTTFAALHRGACRCAVAGLFCCVLSEVLVANRLYAQAKPSQPLRSLTGVAYDSLSESPLAGALIQVEGLYRTAVSDGHGRFRLDSLPGGTFTLLMFHDAVDALGLGFISRTTTLTEGMSDVPIAIPGIDHMWRTLCGDMHRDVGRGIVFGNVSSATDRAPLAATVNLDALVVALSNGKLKTQNWRGEVRTDTAGYYAFCGVPVSQEITITAVHVDGSTPALRFTPTTLVRRQNLLIEVAHAGTGHMANVSGRVVDDAARPVEGAIIRLEGSGETRSYTDGTFELHDVPYGTRQIVATSIGAQPTGRIIQVTESDTRAGDIELSRVTQLPTVAVTARSIRQRWVDGIARRRALEVGRAMDSTELARFADVWHSITFMVKPSKVCAIWLDGKRAELRDVLERDWRDIAVVESVLSPFVPMQFRPPKFCNVLLVWTKNGLP